MSSKTNQLNKKIPSRQTLMYFGLAAYLLATAIFSFILFKGIEGLDIKIALMVFVTILFICGLGPAYRIASNAKSKIIALAGTVSLAVLFVFPGFFLVLALGWSIAVTHAA